MPPPLSGCRGSVAGQPAARASARHPGGTCEHPPEGLVGQQLRADLEAEYAREFDVEGVVLPDAHIDRAGEQRGFRHRGHGSARRHRSLSPPFCPSPPSPGIGPRYRTVQLLSDDAGACCTRPWPRRDRRRAAPRPAGLPPVGDLRRGRRPLARATTPRPARAGLYYHPSRHSVGQPIVAGLSLTVDHHGDTYPVGCRSRRLVCSPGSSTGGHGVLCC